MNRKNFIGVLAGICGLGIAPGSAKKEPDPIKEMELYSEGQYMTTEIMNEIPDKINQIVDRLNKAGK